KVMLCWLAHSPIDYLVLHSAQQYSLNLNLRWQSMQLPTYVGDESLNYPFNVYMLCFLLLLRANAVTANIKSQR
ncbi:hypothetical protein CWC05_21990, partial [Pseudoalteromonas ruthenica]